MRHHRGATLGLGSARRLTLIERNRVLLAVKLFPWNLLWLNGAYYATRIGAGLWAALRNRGELRHYSGTTGKLTAAMALVRGTHFGAPADPVDAPEAASIPPEAPADAVADPQPAAAASDHAAGDLGASDVTAARAAPPRRRLPGLRQHRSTRPCFPPPTGCIAPPTKSF